MRVIDVHTRTTTHPGILPEVNLDSQARVAHGVRCWRRRAVDCRNKGRTVAAIVPAPWESISLPRNVRRGVGLFGWLLRLERHHETGSERGVG